jgi:nitrate/nitrite-specific signal transduction histidine kinase
MIEQTTSQPKQRTRVKPLSPAGIALIRIIYDALIFILALSAIFNVGDPTGIVLGFPATAFNALMNGLILIGSIAAFFLIRRNRINQGINLLIYSLIIGTFIISVFIESTSTYGLLMTLFFTIWSISWSLSFREGIPPILATIFFGITALAIDTIFEGAAFRAQPAFGTQSAVAPSVLFGVLIIYMVIRQFPIFTLQAKLITSFVFVAAISLGLLLLSTIVSFQQILTSEADEALFAAASQTADSIEDLLTYYTQTVEGLATIPTVIEFTEDPQNTDSAEVTELLNIFASQEDETILSYSLINTAGEVIADSNPENVGLPAKNFRPFFETLQSINTMVTDVYYDPGIDGPIMYISTPIKSRAISAIGMLRLELNANFLQELIERSSGLVGEDSFAVLFDEYFVHLAHGTHPETLFTTVMPLTDDLFADLKTEQRLPDLGPEDLFLTLPELETSLIAAQRSVDPVTFFNASDVATGDRTDRGAAVKVLQTPWIITFFQPEDVFLRPLATLGDTSVFFLILAGIIATVFAFILSQVIVRPIATLNNTASAIIEGDFSSRADIISQDEIGNLGNTFNMMAIQLQNLIENLEAQVSSRTEELQNQTAQLKATAEIARDATSEEEIKFLLERASHLLYDRFDFYHVGIYLVDGRGHYAILSSSQDPQGLELINNEHRYMINSESSVGRVCVTGLMQRSSTADQDSEIHPHPLLPDTQAQLSLPLQAGGKILGVIDIHSTDPNAFSEEEAGIFGTFSDQIAIAIQRTEFSQEIQDTLNELESAYGQFTQESWRRFIQGKRERFAGYRFRQLSVEPLAEQPTEVVQAWEAGEVISQRQPGEGTSHMAIPMKIRGEVIGVLDLEFETELVPPDTQTLMTEIADRLSLVLENARLIQSAQQQVERQQLAAHLTNQISQSLDLDTVLRTATQEIGEALGIADVEVRLGSIDLGFQMSDNGDSIQDDTPSYSPPPIDPGEAQLGTNEEDYEPTN